MEQGDTTSLPISVFVTALLTIYPAKLSLEKVSTNTGKLSFLLFITTLPILVANILYTASYYPNILEKTENGNFKYYVVSLLDMDSHGYMAIYKCKKWTFDCEGLYGSYTHWADKIIVDKEDNEVNFVETAPYPGLIYTDGNVSHVFVESTSIQMENRLYFLSEDQILGNCNLTRACDSYIYTLYECKSDYTSCDPLPIRYITNYQNFLYLEAEEITNEISLFDGHDDTLIFTWSDNPRCYIEGCEIVEGK